MPVHGGYALFKAFTINKRSGTLACSVYDIAYVTCARVMMILRKSGMFKMYTVLRAKRKAYCV